MTEPVAQPAPGTSRPAPGTSGPAGAVPIELPDGLAAMPPGPELAAALARLDPARLTAHQLVVVVAAHNRQIAHQQAQLLVAIREPGTAPPAERDRVVRDRERNPYATVETAFAMTWTAYRCEQMVGLADFVLDEVPALGQALAAGRVDLDKVKVFSRALSQVTDAEVARRIVDLALARAGRETTATLRERLHRLIVKADPEALRKRRERDHQDRFVWRFPEAGGLVMIQARFCDATAATAAFEHLDALAKATKAAGDAHGRSIDQLRHDIALSLLAGVDPASAGMATPAGRKGTIVLHVDLATRRPPSPARPRRAALGVRPVWSGRALRRWQRRGVRPVPAGAGRPGKRARADRRLRSGPCLPRPDRRPDGRRVAVAVRPGRRRTGPCRGRPAQRAGRRVDRADAPVGGSTPPPDPTAAPTASRPRHRLPSCEPGTAGAKRRGAGSPPTRARSTIASPGTAAAPRVSTIFTVYVFAITGPRTTAATATGR